MDPRTPRRDSSLTATADKEHSEPSDIRIQNVVAQSRFPHRRRG